MNGTPRPSGTFPSTPQTTRSTRQRAASNAANTPTRRPNVGAQLPQVPRPEAETRTGPLIPTDILDAPTQRFYVFAIYVGLLAYRLYDFYTLAVDDTESLWLFMKWIAVDGVFLFSLPLFQIPWLEWSNVVLVALFLLHAALDFMLMFRVGLPIQAWVLPLVKLLYDRELAISERNIDPRSIIHNASLILGKQIIHILPEGSAVLNPNKDHFCLSPSVHQVDIPIQINQTEPTLIELTRIDLETSKNETISIAGREMRGLLSKARKSVKHVDPDAPLLVRYTVKKTGIYLLQKVVDKSKLEVRPRTSHVTVASCPRAWVRQTNSNRCRNDLSDVSLAVEGAPPLRIKYRTTVNGHPREAAELQSLQPDDFMSPLSRHTSQALIRSSREDVSWAQSRLITVPLNETLGSSGVWTYSVEEVQDALGNVVNYVSVEDEDRPKQKSSELHQSLTVHERPSVVLDGCSPTLPLNIAKGTAARLPVKFSSTGKGAIMDAAHTIEYLFTPLNDLLPSGDHGPNAEVKAQTLKSPREQPQIRESGLYTVKSISTEFCAGEVLEPASCLLQNPPEPQLSITSEDIVDKCAGNPIGLRLQLDFVGTPPFRVRYFEQRKGRPKQTKILPFETLRGSIDLTPRDAGHYTYTFDSITDWVYKEERALHDLVLEQDVRPSASAHFIDASKPKQACIDDAVEFDVGLQGDGPWKLDYELVHSGKRTRFTANVEEEHFTIKTPKLKNGGEYVLTLTSITDKMGCKDFLKAEAKVNVRHERPKAYFGVIEGRQSVLALEDKAVELPLRLTGTGPWELEYENLDTHDVQKRQMKKANTQLGIKSAGTYKLLSVRDSVCPGSVDEKASQFQVSWIPRPKISIAELPTITLENGVYVKEAVCEGEEDTFDILFNGNPPYEVTYEQHFKDTKNGKSQVQPKKILKASSGSATVRTETSRSGLFEYKFVQIADNKYDATKMQPVVVQQTVNPLPSARFANPGKTYSYCSREEDGEEVIPMVFEGVAPFYLEIEIKHHGTPKPETVSFKNIQTTKYDLRIPHRLLQLGHSNISIRKIRDSRNCARKPAPNSSRVQVSVHDAPSVSPLEARSDFCVGERLSFALSGQAPFTVYYTFNGQEKKATNTNNNFRRLAETPGNFTITGIRDSASECLGALDLSKEIHPIPSVRLSHGRVSEVDIHEGGETDLEFDFNGTPPFEFTYTRSTNAQRGRKSKVLEIRTETSYEHRMVVRVQEEGTYEVVSIKDRWCSFARPIEGAEGVKKNGNGNKLLQY